MKLLVQHTMITKLFTAYSKNFLLAEKCFRNHEWTSLYEDQNLYPMRTEL